jgi:heme-degrading monooxygenase HmoA
MLKLRMLDENVPIQEQLNDTASPAVLINIFTVGSADVDALLAAWEHDGNWMKKQPGYISTQLHRGIGGSCTFINYAVWESVDHFRRAFTGPEFQAAMRAYPSSTVAMPHLFTKIAVSNLCTI